MQLVVVKFIPNMFKSFLYTIFFILVAANVSSQTVTVISGSTNFPIPGIIVYSNSLPDTLQTNNVGEVSLDIFDNSDAIVFEHFVFENVRKTKEEIIDNDYKVVMYPSGMLANENKSVITAAEYSKDLPFYVKIIDSDENKEISSLSSNDDGSEQKLMFEKNKSGSTVFRGLQANKVILVLDGVRLNNALYRNGKISGPIHFENSSLESVEQIHGAGFIMYGADAIGGVVKYFTKIPEFKEYNNFSYKINAATHYETATDNWVSNVNFNLGAKKFASYTSLTYGDYGKITMGKNRASYLDSEYGLNPYYVERINNKDSVIKNQDPYTQENTNYKQYLFIQKFRYHPTKNLNIILNLNYNTSSTIKYYGGLTETNAVNLRFAEIEFRPQDKLLTSLSFFYNKKTKFYDFVSLISSYQFIEEYRYSRKLNSTVGLHQIEHLYDGAINLDFIKVLDINRITYGTEVSYNNLKTNAFFQNIETDSTWNGLNRYPTNGTDMQTFSAYFSHKWMRNPQFIVNAGIRYDYTHSKSGFENQLDKIVKNPQMTYCFDEIIYNSHAPSASLSFDYYPITGMQISILNSFSVHSPIVDEFGKIMMNNTVALVPNNVLKSEKSANIEIGVSQILFESLKINVGVFNSWIKDAIIISDMQINGIDSLWLGIDGYEIATKVNINNAQIYGISGGINFGYFFGNKDKNFIKFNSSFNYIKGINKDDNIALPNIPPLFGQSAVSLKLSDYTLRFSHIYNGMKKIEDLSIYSEDNIHKAADFGFMAWQSYNIKLSYTTNDYLSIHFAINNLLDTFYRSYASSISSPGRNFMFTLKFSI